MARLNRGPISSPWKAATITTNFPPTPTTPDLWARARSFLSGPSSLRLRLSVRRGMKRSCIPRRRANVPLQWVLLVGLLSSDSRSKRPLIPRPTRFRLPSFLGRVVILHAALIYVAPSFPPFAASPPPFFRTFFFASMPSTPVACRFFYLISRHRI